MRRDVCFDHVLVKTRSSSSSARTSRLDLDHLLRRYQSTSLPYDNLLRLHAAILELEDDPSRFHLVVAPWQLDPTFLSGVFETPLAYSTLHKTMPSLTPFSVLYRKAFPSKRQPRHWISTLNKALNIPAVCIHLIEVYVFFWLGLFSPSRCNPSLSLDSHRTLAILWRTRRDWQRHWDLLRSFYCSPDTNKISICAVAEAFAFACAPFERAMATVSATWSMQYLPHLRTTCDSIRSSFVDGQIRPTADQRAELERFNSYMAAAGPLCTFPVCFWETALTHVRGDLVSAIPDPLERPALIMAFLTHPDALDPWESEFLHRNNVPVSIRLEVLSAVRFLYAFAPRTDSFRNIVPLLVNVILCFYLSRFGPSVLRTSLLEQFALYRAEISRLAWRWDALFSSYRVAWSTAYEARAQQRVTRRIRSLELQGSTQLAVRRIQYCTNCGVIHTHHNGVPPLKANSSVELYRAEMTIGCDMSAFSLVSGTSFCARSGSKMAMHCGETQVVCFYLRGWTYVNGRCFFMCTRCGMQSIWDSSVCFVTLRDGPLCSRCTYCVMIGSTEEEEGEAVAALKKAKRRRKPRY